MSNRWGLADTRSESHDQTSFAGKNPYTVLYCEHFELDGHTVMMAPASGFYASPGAGSDEVRNAYVLDLPMLERAVNCLALALEQYPGRTL